MVASKILVAHDLSEPADRALLFAADLAKQLGATLEVVHVHPDVYDGRSDPALGVPWPSASQEERYMRFLDEELGRVVLATLGEQAQRVKRHILRGDPVKRIRALVEQTGVDMVCLGSTGKGAVQRVLLGSVSLAVVRTCPVPVLTVH